MVFTNLLSVHRFSLPQVERTWSRIKVTVISCSTLMAFIMHYYPNNSLICTQRHLHVSIECLEVIVLIGKKTNTHVCPLFCLLWSKHSHFCISYFLTFSKSSSHSHFKDRIINRPNPQAVSSRRTWTGSYSSSFQQITLRVSPPLPTGFEFWKLLFPFWIYHFIPMAARRKAGKLHVAYIHVYPAAGSVQTVFPAI